MTRTHETEDNKPFPQGLVLFPPGTSPGKKRRRLTFMAVFLAIVASLVWPIYPLFSGIFPLILGLPLSFAWVVMSLAVSFVALVALYVTEEDGGEVEGG
jgi:hypothetical protein